MKKSLFLLLLLSTFTLTGINAQNPVEQFLMGQAEMAVMGRQVDFDNLAKVLQEKKDSIDPYIYNLASVEIAKAANRTAEVISLIDRILLETDDGRLSGYLTYLLNTKGYLLLQEGEYGILGDMADYALGRWTGNNEVVQVATHYRRLAGAAGGIGKVAIKRPEATVAVPLERSLSERGEVSLLWTLTVEANEVPSRRIILDTGNPVGIILGGRFARDAGIRILPDTRTVIPHAWKDRPVDINRGVADSLRIGDIVFYNLPVWVSVEDEFMYSDGILGLAELARLDYVEISPENIVFPWNVAGDGQKPNFHMNAGYTGQGIFVPCLLNGYPYSYYFDTGSGTVITVPGAIAAQDGINKLEIGGQSVVLPQPIEYTDNPYPGEPGLLGQTFIYLFEKIGFDFRNLRMTLGAPSGYTSASTALGSGDHFLMRRNERLYAEREPGLYPLIKAFIAANFNKPGDAVEYASMVEPGNFSMALAMIMIREKAHYDRGEYADAAACSGAGVELVGSLGPHFPEEPRVRLESIFAMDMALSGQPPVSVSVGEPEAIRVEESGGLYFVEAEIQGKGTPVALNAEDYYNEISMQDASNFGVRILSQEIGWNGKQGYIGMADKIRIGNVQLHNVPFFVDAAESPAILGLSILKKFPVIMVSDDGRIRILPAPGQQSGEESKFIRTDIAVYCEEENGERQLTNSAIFAPGGYLKLDFVNMVYSGQF